MRLTFMGMPRAGLDSLYRPEDGGTYESRAYSGRISHRKGTQTADG
jgi:hypothetical protein